MTESSSTRRSRALRWTNDGVELDAGTHVARARRAIVAVPPNVAGLIRFDPALPAWRMRLHQAMTQGDVIKLLAVYDEPFWRADGLAGEGFAPYQLVREVYDNTPPGGAPGVLCTFLAGEKAEWAGQARSPPSGAGSCSTGSRPSSGLAHSTPAT